MESNNEKIKSLDYVRSFDFADGPDYGRDLDGPDAFYVEGTVIKIVKINGCDRYKILTFREVKGGKESLGGSFVFPPVNGMKKLFGGVTDGVELLSK